MTRLPWAFALLPLLCWLAGVPAWSEQTLSAAEYRRALGAIETQLRAGEWASASEQARVLLGARVSAGGQVLAADASVLEPVLVVADVGSARQAASALALLRDALEKVEVRNGEVGAPDRERLARLAAAQKVSGPEAGGEVTLPAIERPGFWQRALEAMAEAGEKALEWLTKLRDWLLERMKSKQSEKGAAIDTRLVVVLVGLAALVLGLLAWRRRRSAEMPEAVEHGEPIVSGAAGDADPLSREQDEWQRYARELETQGRLREAIRAWYHAVLVALYRRGLLQYRKGRTNWEYVAALSPTLAWRPRFIALTRVFESEWYGRAASSAEALARGVAEARGVLGGLEEGGGA